MAHKSSLVDVALAASLVTLAIVSPLNSLIQANPDEPVCRTCLSGIYLSALAAAFLVLRASARLWGGALRPYALNALTLAALLPFINTLRLTMVSSEWSIPFLLVCGLLLLPFVVSFFRKREQAARGFLLCLVPLVLFELASLVFAAASGEDAERGAAPPQEATALAGTRAPHVVLIVFDEFSLLPALDGARIDAEVAPNLEAFSQTATWYRRAVTSHDYTAFAIPALLTGSQDVDTFAREFLGDQEPDNLFGALAGSHRIYVSGFAMQYCRAFAGHLSDCRQTLLGLSSTALILSKWWQRAVPRVARRTFPVSLVTERVTRLSGSLYSMDPDAPSSLLAALRPIPDFRSPVFAYVHVALPHHPYVFERDGEQRAWSGTQMRGVSELDPEELAEAHRQYTEQIGYADRLLGELLERLSKDGVFENAIIVVTSDHGISFDPEHPGRAHGWVDAGIARVPLLVKTPGQREGSIDDRPASIIDILPTVLDALERDPDGTLDGRSLLEPEWDPAHQPVTYSVTCENECEKGQRHTGFRHADNGAITKIQRDGNPPPASGQR